MTIEKKMKPFESCKRLMVKKTVREEVEMTMRNFLHVSVVLVMTIILLGCGKESVADGANQQAEAEEESRKEQEPDLEGFVMRIENSTILVVSEESEDFSATGGMSEFYKAIWVSGVREELNIGQKVQIWIDGPILESYPAQAQVKFIEVLPNERIDGATLTKTDVIQKALDAIDTEDVIAIKSMNFDLEAHSWTVEILNTFTNQADIIHIDDQ